MHDTEHTTDESFNPRQRFTHEEDVESKMLKNNAQTENSFEVIKYNIKADSDYEVLQDSNDDADSELSALDDEDSELDDENINVAPKKIIIIKKHRGETDISDAESAEIKSERVRLLELHI